MGLMNEAVLKLPSLPGYRGRIAPSPTGYLHLGHARTFWVAQQRAATQGGTLVLRNEDLDRVRCKPEFVAAMLEDLKWFGVSWQEGPDCGGPVGPYSQSERYAFYSAVLSTLWKGGSIYPCTCSRQNVLRSAQAPHHGEEEPVYPGTCRCRTLEGVTDPRMALRIGTGQRFSWRFRVPDGREVVFEDALQGRRSYVAGRDFGDFVVWRHDDVPAYQLAVVADDALMGITEVVRGEDLLLSTARQILLYEVLGLRVPGFCHCPLVRDAEGKRLAKRHDALSLRALRAEGMGPEALQIARVNH